MTNSKALEKSGGFPTEKVELIKRTIAKDCTTDELQLFIHTAIRLRLDPLAKQIYCWKEKKSGRLIICVGIDGFRSIADRTKLYCPGAETEIEYDKAGNLHAITVYVKKFVGGEWHQVSARAKFSEYNAPYKDNWKRMPEAMLEKCAEAKALRKGFPLELSGVYSNDEMDQADRPNGPITIEPVEVVSNPRPGAAVSRSRGGSLTPVDAPPQTIGVDKAIAGLKKKWAPFVKERAKALGVGPRVCWWQLIEDSGLPWTCKKEKGEKDITVYARWTHDDVSDFDTWLGNLAAAPAQNPTYPELPPDPDPPPPPDVPADPFTGDYMDSGVQRELGD